MPEPRAFRRVANLADGIAVPTAISVSRPQRRPCFRAPIDLGAGRTSDASVARGEAVGVGEGGEVLGGIDEVGEEGGGVEGGLCRDHGLIVGRGGWGSRGGVGRPLGLRTDECYGLKTNCIEIMVAGCQRRKRQKASATHRRSSSLRRQLTSDGTKILKL